MVKVFLPWMDKDLFRNRERTQHWGVRQKASKAAREQGYLITLAAMQDHKPFKPEKEIPVVIFFYPPDRRRRDLDGMLSALKPNLDGVSDALKIDDQYFNPVTIRRGKVRKDGEVEVWIGT